MFFILSKYPTNFQSNIWPLKENLRIPSIWAECHIRSINEFMTALPITFLVISDRFYHNSRIVSKTILFVMWKLILITLKTGKKLDTIRKSISLSILEGKYIIIDVLRKFAASISPLLFIHRTKILFDCFVNVIVIIKHSNKTISILI